MEIVEKATADIIVAVNLAVTGVKALTGASVDVILGVNVDVSICINLFAKVFIVSLCRLGARPCIR